MPDTRLFFIHYRTSSLALSTDNAVNVPKSSSPSPSDLLNQIHVLEIEIWFHISSNSFKRNQSSLITVLELCPDPSPTEHDHWAFKIITNSNIFVRPKTGYFSNYYRRSLSALSTDIFVIVPRRSSSRPFDLLNQISVSKTSVIESLSRTNDDALTENHIANLYYLSTLLSTTNSWSKSWLKSKD